MEKGKLRVAIASSGLGHVARGMEAWAESVAAALHKRGVKVTLFRGAGPTKNDYDVVLPCIKRTSRLAKIGNILNRVGGWRVGLGSEAAVESFSYGVQLLWRLRNGYDIVHVQQGSLALFLDRARKLGLLRCPIVLGNGQKASPEFLRRFDYVHFLSPYGMKEITDCIERKPGWRVIPNFVDTQVFSPGDKAASRQRMGLPQDCLLILSVGMIDSRVKRMDYFVTEAAAFASTFSKKVHFVIAGSRHTDSPEIIRLGEELLGDKLTVLFDVERERMVELYRSADIFVLCSLREALGMAIIEAMSCDVPPICHSFPVMEWVIGECGASVNMSEQGRLSSVLTRFSSKSESRESAGFNARERVLSVFEKEAVTKKMIEMYHAISSAKNEMETESSKAYADDGKMSPSRPEL